MVNSNMQIRKLAATGKRQQREVKKMSDATMTGGGASADSGHGLRKVLTWKDGLAIAMVMPAGAVASYGY